MRFFFLIVQTVALLLVFHQPGIAQAENKAGLTQRNSNEKPPTPRKGKDWTDPLSGIEFVWVDKGCFPMGSPSGDKERGPDEGPMHDVCVDGFWLGKYEVTQNQFKKFAVKAGYRTEAEKKGGCYVWIGSKRQRKPKANWKNPNHLQEADSTVVCVSWNDAGNFAGWLNNQYTGIKFRLPTESEWEYAARAGSNTNRYWGNNPAEACEYANVADLTAKKSWPSWPTHNCDDGFKTTAPVGSFKPNDFGLHDMLGNVWEWCQDWYSYSSYYKKSPRKNPMGPKTGKNRVFRGGSWNHDPRHVRLAARARISQKSSTDFIGFRLVAVPTKSAR